MAKSSLAIAVAVIAAVIMGGSSVSVFAEETAEGKAAIQEKVRSLVKGFNDNDQYVANAAREALLNMQDAYFPFLSEMLSNNEDADLVGPAISMMPANARQIQAIRPNLQSQYPQVRAEAARILAEWNDTGSFKLVEKLLNDKEVKVRERAIWAYERLGKDYDKRILAGLLRDDSDPVRVDASRVLGRGAGTPDPEIEAPLIFAAKNDKDIRVRKHSLYALGYNRLPGAILPLLEALDDPDEDTQAHALAGLSELKDVAAYPYILKPFLEKRDISGVIAGESANALISLGKPVDVRLFYPYLKIQDFDAQRNLLILIEANAKGTDRKEAAEEIKKAMSTINYMLTDYAREVITKLEK